MTELEDRLRAYGTVLDRTAAAGPESGGSPMLGGLTLVADDLAPPKRGRATLVVVAAAVSIMVGIGVLLDSGVTDETSGLRPAAPGDPSAIAPHSDVEGCIRSGIVPSSDEGPYQARWKACVAALTGDIVASGVIGGVPWELLASDEPPLRPSPSGSTDGHWVTLRAAGLDGVFRGSFWESSPPGEAENLLSSVGPCCRLGDATVVVAVTRADVVRVRLERDGVTIAEAATVADPATPWNRYAVLGAPTQGPARVVLEMADGTTARPLTGPLDLATIGG